MAFENDKQDASASRYGITYTELEQHFWQTYCSYWSRPKECDEASIANGTSPYCWFRTWMNEKHPPLSVSVMDSCMKTFADSGGHFGPRLGQLRDLYVQKTKSSREAAQSKSAPPKEKCDLCSSDGLVHVTSLTEPGRKARPISVVVLVKAAARFAHRPVPCRCTAGAEANRRWYGYSDEAWKKLFDMRTTPLQHRNLAMRCRGMEPPNLGDSSAITTAFGSLVGKVMYKLQEAQSAAELDDWDF